MDLEGKLNQEGFFIIIMLFKTTQSSFLLITKFIKLTRWQYQQVHIPTTSLFPYSLINPYIFQNSTPEDTKKIKKKKYNSTQEIIT